MAIVAAILLDSGTTAGDLFRYAAYALLAVVLPGTLVFRTLRRTPHTLVEDIAMGAAVGLVLELAAWVVVVTLDVRQWAWLWPLAVIVPFTAVGRLRRHWFGRGYRLVPMGWSWAVAGVVVFFTYYLSQVFLERNPILPTSEDTQQYLDLSYQLSLAGEAKHQFPIHLPQVAEEPLHYHWFGYIHMAMASLVGHIDLPVVALRLAIPVLCAAAIVLTAVVGWRVSGRPYVGVGAAVLFFVIGEVNFTHFVTQPFGTQAAFVIWHGMSMIYSWVLLIALVLPLAELVRIDSRQPHRLGRAGALALAALLLFASSGAKASSVPTAAVALAVAAVALLVTQRRIPWAVVGAGLIAAAAQFFATAVLYAFNTYGVEPELFGGLKVYYQDSAGQSPWPQWVVFAAVFMTFLINMESRVVGVLPLLWLRKFRLDPVQWLLLGGAVGGPALFLVFNQPAGGNQYFTRAGFTFGVIISAWGWATVLDRARLPVRAKVALAAFAVVLAIVLVAVQLEHATSPPEGRPYSQLVPIMRWSFALGLVALTGAALWVVAGWVWRPLYGRGAAVLLTAVLVSGAPGLIMDIHKSRQVPNGGAYALVSMPASRVAAARWVRDHSDPSDVVATNVHCLGLYNGWCDARSFWLSAYAERRVLVEGWAFAPRLAQGGGIPPFWDKELLAANDEAFAAPTAAGLAGLRDRHRVRYLVVDRTVSRESPDLVRLAGIRFDNGRLAVYELR